MNKILLSTFTVALLLSGCSNKQAVTKQSGFLDDYSALKPSPYKDGALLYVAPDANIPSYKNVIVEPAHIIINSEELKTKTGLVKEMSDYLTQKIKNRIEKNPNFNLVTKPKENTLRVEFAITGVTVSHDDMETYQFIPVALVLTGAARATGITDKRARVLMELKVSDANSGRNLVKVIDLQAGEKVVLTEKELTLDHLKPALDAWTKHAAERLERMKKKRAAAK